ncbi:MAG TPA: polyprenyl synthetase family protein, partial [Pilimelia sp.]|nr:polyprenyl synthetase family protein [Pilimelia sp.]
MATDAPPAPVDQAPCRQRPPGRDISAAVDAHLSRFVADQSDALRDLDAGLEPLAAAAAAAVLDGGKRLRPTFAHWGWRGVAGPDAPLPPVLPALAALEVLHAFALVHDDVMDASAQRRGRPSTHRAFTDLHRARGLRGDAGRFGESAAVLVGDLLLVWADQLIAAA